MISTEALLTSPEGFGLTTATAAQRAACRILDGQPLAELAAHPDVVSLVGGAEGLAQLPSMRPVEVVFLAAIRTAKTMIACAAAIAATQRVDVSRLGPGEIPRVSLVSLKLDVTAVPLAILRGVLAASPSLKAIVLDDSADVITLRHPSGRPIEIAVVAGSKAGGGLVARWSAGVIFDEAPRMNGSSDAVVNLDDARSAVLGRLLPGAQVLYIGSPWAPHGPVYELVTEHWQRPTPGMVVLRGTGPMLNPQWWTPERCTRLQDADPAAYQTDVLGEFADPESGLLNPIAVRRNTRETPLEIPPERGARYVAAVDPSEGALHGNAWTLVIVQHDVPGPPWTWSPASGDWRKPDTEKRDRRLRVVGGWEWRGLGPGACWAQIAKVCGRYGISTVWTDQYAASAQVDLARHIGLHVRVDRTTATSKLEDFTNLATLVHTDAIELPPHREMRRDLLSVRRRTTQQGATIALPKTGDGRHCDYAPALCAAVKHAEHASKFRGPVGFHVPGL